MLAIVSRELAKACYHKSCCRNYTRNIPVSEDKKEDSEYTEYSLAELQGYEKLVNYIRTDLLQNPRKLRLSELHVLFTSFVNSQGQLEIPESTRTHFRRILEKSLEVRSIWKICMGTIDIFAIARNLPTLDLPKQVTVTSNSRRRPDIC